MARIRRFIEGDREVKPPQSEVDAYVQRVHDSEGTLFLYLYNYKAGGPSPGDTPTRTARRTERRERGNQRGQQIKGMNVRLVPDEHSGLRR